MSPTTVAPLTTVVDNATGSPAGEPLVVGGTIDLGSADLIARTVDGDVWWYPDALGAAPAEPVLLIDRGDPRELPVEGPPPNYVDHVAGTFRGALIYSDCCEPVSGNLLAITEPGAEADREGTASGQSERFRLLGVGYGPRLEPDGTRVLAYNWDGLNVVDLVTGEQQFVSPAGMFADPEQNTTGAPFNAIDVSWAGPDSIVVLGVTDGELILTEHLADDIGMELQRAALGPHDFDRRAQIIGVVDGTVTVALSGIAPIELLDIELDRFTPAPTNLEYAVPDDASSVRLSPEGSTAAWIIDDVAYVQRSGEPPTEFRSGLADIWFPISVATS